MSKSVTIKEKPKPFPIKRCDLRNRLNAAKGKTLGSVDKENVFKITETKPKVTGIAGSVIETSVIGYPPNSGKMPDLDVEEDNGTHTLTELKTTGVRKSGKTNKLAAKEPASITAVSINKIASEKFESSGFYEKIEHLLFVFYHYASKKTVKAADYKKFKILDYHDFQFSDEQLKILKNDWQIIHDFIKKIQEEYPDPDMAAEKYPDLSTLINPKLVMLDTAPKYPHPPRFRIKKDVVTAIYYDKMRENTGLPSDLNSYRDLIIKCQEISKKYKEKHLDEILRDLKISFEQKRKNPAKHYAELVAAKMFNEKASKMIDIEFFRADSVVPKTIILTKKGKRTEDLKLMPVVFDELEEKVFSEDDLASIEAIEGNKIPDRIIRSKTFEDSDLSHALVNRKILFMIFQEPSCARDTPICVKDVKFLGFKFCSLATKKIRGDNGPTFCDEAERTWNDVRKLIFKKKVKNEPVLNKDGSQRYTPKTKLPMYAPNFPKSEQYAVFFRGTGSDAQDKKETRFGFPMYKQDYWIKGTAIVSALEREPFLHDMVKAEIEKTW